VGVKMYLLLTNSINCHFFLTCDIFEIVIVIFTNNKLSSIKIKLINNVAFEYNEQIKLNATKFLFIVTRFRTLFFFQILLPNKHYD